MSPFNLGEEALRFISSNPSNIILKSKMKDGGYGKRGYDGYITDVWESYSFLQIYFDDPQMTVITKDAKVTLPDMISSIGGTIGIFLGLSTLSIFDELINWIESIVKSLNRKYRT